MLVKAIEIKSERCYSQMADKNIDIFKNAKAVSEKFQCMILNVRSMRSPGISIKIQDNDLVAHSNSMTTYLTMSIDANFSLIVSIYYSDHAKINYGLFEILYKQVASFLSFYNVEFNAWSKL